MFLTTLKRHRFLILIVCLFIFLRLPSLIEPYWYGDEGIYLTLGQGIRHGLVLYRDIHDNKPPTLYYLAALAQTVFGFRLLLSLVMIPTVYFFYRLAKHFFSLTISQVLTLVFLIITSIPLIEGNIANAEIFMLLPTILGIYLFLTTSYTLLPALLLGLAFTIKIPVAVEFGFICFWLLFLTKSPLRTNTVRLIITAAGFFLPFALIAFYYYTKGAIQNFLVASIFQNFGYLSSWVTGSHQSSAASGGLVYRLLILGIFYVFIYVFYRLKKISLPSVLILLWFAACLFGALLSGRPYPHYLIQLTPPLCLTLGLIIKRRYLYTLPLIFLAFILIKFNFYYYPVFSYYYHSYSHLVGLESLSQYRSFFGPDVNQIYQISSFLSANSAPTDHLFVWGDQPYLYPLSNRLPVTKYVVAYHIVDFQQYTFTIDQIKSDPPKFIVYYPMSGRPYPELDQFINYYYFLRQQIGQVLIYQFRKL